MPAYVTALRPARYVYALSLFLLITLLLSLASIGAVRAQVPQAVGVAAGTGGLSWVLWNNPESPDKSASLWKINGDAAGTVAAVYTYGPYPGWTARSIAAGSDGVPRILWINTSGQVALWTVNVSTGAHTESDFGPYPGYTATALAISPNNTAPRLLWNKSDGSITLWNVDAAGDQPGNGTSTQFVFSAFTGYTATALAVGGDNLPRILWTKAGGNASLWKVDTSGGYTHQEYGAYTNYIAAALAAGPDALVRIPWVYTPDGTLSLWKVDATGSFTYQNYGPYPGWSVQAIAVSSDNVAHPLWDNVNGSFALWNITSSGSSTQITYPIPNLVSLSPGSVVGGSSSAGTVTLNCPSPYGGTVVGLSSSNTSVATVPSSVTVAAGSRTATFPISTLSTSTATSVTIAANYNGVSSSTALGVTPPAPAGPTGLTAAVNAAQTQIALAWTAPSGQVTSYKVLRGTAPGAESATPIATVTGTPPATAYTDAGPLTAGSTYYYKVVAVNAGGSSSPSAEAYAALKPAAPANLTATAGNGQIVLTWSASTGTVSYNVKRATVSGGPYTTISTSGNVTGTSFTSTGLTNGTPYYYIVTAVNAGGESAPSVQATATPTTTPQSVTAIGGDAQLLVTWGPVANAVGYNIYRSTSAGGEGTTPINSQPNSANAFLDTGLSTSTTYYYKVSAVFASLPQSAQSSEASAATSSSPTQDSQWLVTPPSASNFPAPIVTSNTTSTSMNIGSTLVASVLVSGQTSPNGSASAEATCAGTWKFRWTGSTWPTLYVIQHQQKALYSASVNAGTGTAQVANSGGSVLVSAAYPPTGTQITATPSVTFTYNTADLTLPVMVATSTLHVAGGMPAPGQTTGTLTGWSETSTSTILTQSIYTQQWFQSHFASPSNIVLQFTVPLSDVTATSNLSNATTQGSASAIGNVSDFYFGF